MILIGPNDIKKTTKGWRVEKKIAGQPRLRKTFDSYDEAEEVLKMYLQGKGEQVAKIAPTAITWKDLWRLTIKWQWSEGKSTKQQKNAERAIERYLGWDNDVRDFDQEAADQLHEMLCEDVPSKTTVSRYNSAVRCMLKMGKAKGKITWKLPTLKSYQQEETRINFFEFEQEKQITSIMKQMCRPDMADLFTLLIETGFRTSEGRMLLWRDVDLENRSIILWGAETKTGKSRSVYITDRCLEVLKRRQLERTLEPRVFPDATLSRLRSTWTAIRQATGNYDKDFVWYTTRHTCASRLLRNGVDIKTVQMWLGHTNINTTMRYIQFCVGSLQGAAEALNTAWESHEEKAKQVVT